MSLTGGLSSGLSGTLTTGLGGAPSPAPPDAPSLDFSKASNSMYIGSLV